MYWNFAPHKISNVQYLTHETIHHKVSIANRIVYFQVQMKLSGAGCWSTTLILIRNSNLQKLIVRCGARRMTPAIIIKTTGNEGRCFL
jgi:hypothetical protein